VNKGRKKLESKRADFVVVNNVLEPGAGFEVETNVVTLVGPGWEEALPLQPKTSVAAAILDRAERLLSGSPGGVA
jgi:phosphopantothenoylcysteine decarboxylase/phosphopantothenate--cysteine ligase